jgi:hypothetical protein
MVDSILTNQAPIVQTPVQNRSVTSAAVSDASNVPDLELSIEAVDVTPRTMDSNSEGSFSSPATPQLTPIISTNIGEGELRPPLENFRPIELTSERALENRVADLEIRPNNQVDETDSQVSVNNSAIEAFTGTEQSLQQAVDLTA